MFWSIEAKDDEFLALRPVNGGGENPPPARWDSSSNPLFLLLILLSLTGLVA